MPTFRVTYTAICGPRAVLIQDVVADAHHVEGIPPYAQHVLTAAATVIGQQRIVVVLRVAAVDVVGVRRHCTTPARWGGVLLPRQAPGLVDDDQSQIGNRELTRSQVR